MRTRSLAGILLHSKPPSTFRAAPTPAIKFFPHNYLHSGASRRLRPFSSNKRTLESKLSISLVTVGFIAIAIGIYGAYTGVNPKSSISDPPLSQSSESASGPYDPKTLTMPEIKQGWPGNLTPEQEQKLKEFWLALGQVTGMVQDAAPRTSQDTPANGSATEPDTPKKKSKRFGLFGRGDKDDSDSRNRSENNTEDDKYGQTKQFKQALQDLTKPELHATIWSFLKGDSPDAGLLRFLRARKWNVQNAMVMLVSTVHWRLKDVKMDEEILPRGEQWFAEKGAHGSGAEKKLGDDFMTQIRLGKSFLHGVDKQGRPICLVRVRLHRGGEQSEEALEKYTIYTIETARLLLTEHTDTAGILFDMTDFSMANMDWTPVRFIIKIFEANYPESLGHVWVHHSPWVFSSIWSIIKGWLDPVVAAKVHFTKDANELAEFIPLENIPKELGGKEDFEYRYIEPKTDENKEMEEAKNDGRLEMAQKERAALIDEFEKETLRWCRGEGGDEVVKRRGELKDELKKSYWRMDPFIRARTLYDRQGIIGRDGEIDMYPRSTSKKTHDDYID